MLTKSDCMSILVKMEKDGIDINQYMKKLVVSKDIPLDVLRFISKNNGIEVTNFYEMLRKKHNEHKSQLYTSIIKEKDAEQSIIITLSSLLQQVILYGNKLENGRDRFFKEVRAEEISRVLNEYFKTGDMVNCLPLIKLIKTDILVLEYINGRRELE